VTEVRDAPEEGRLVLQEDGYEAELVYHLHRDRIVLLHSEVPKALKGNGMAELLVRAALKKAASGGLTIVPWCPFARRWLEEHPDYAGTASVDWATSPPEPGDDIDRYLDAEEEDSFPASDAHSDWAGGAT
jgi:uncharacterized protein